MAEVAAASPRTVAPRAGSPTTSPRTVPLLSFMESDAFYYFTWQNVRVSALLFALGASLWLAHAALGYSLATVAAHLVVIALGVGLAVGVNNALAPSKPLPHLRLPLDPNGIRHVSAVAAEKAIAAVAAANGVLGWTDTVASGRALAYAWLAARLAWLASPPYLLLAWLVAFGVAPAARLGGPHLDRVWQAQVAPRVDAAAAQYARARQQMQTWYRENKATVPYIAGGVAVVAGYLFWDWISLTGLATLASLAVTAVDGVTTFAQAKAE